MWTEDYCPICKDKLICNNDEITRIICPNQVVWFSIRYHYESRHKNNKQYYEEVIIYPYLIDSYEGSCSIYKYREDGLLSRRILAEVPAIKFNYYDIEACLQKIKLYVLMS